MDLPEYVYVHTHVKQFYIKTVESKKTSLLVMQRKVNWAKKEGDNRIDKKYDNDM